MKSTKSKLTLAASPVKSAKAPAPRVTEACGSFANIDMPFKQSAAFETIMTATGNDEFTSAAKVISIGLFVLGLDSAGDYCLGEFTDALYGKGSSDGNAVHGSIADAGAEAWGRYSNVTRENRSRASVVCAGTVTPGAGANA